MSNVLIASQFLKKEQLIPGKTHVLVSSHNNNAVSKHFKIQCHIIIIYFSYFESSWSRQGSPGPDSTLLVGSRPTPCISYLPWNSTYARHVLQEGKPSMQAHFKPIFTSHLLASLWPNKSHSHDQSQEEEREALCFRGDGGEEGNICWRVFESTHWSSSLLPSWVSSFHV